MQTRKKLAAYGSNYTFGSGPLAEIADKLFEANRAHEASRMAAAEERAAAQGTGPYLAALTRLAAEQATQALQNCAAPCVLSADFHELLRQAAADQPGDRGLRMCKAHAYKLWMKDPVGSLTVGDVARLRAHYISEYPRSKVGAIIDNNVSKVGFNTLPLTRLYRVAAAIATDVDAGNDAQETYEYYIRREALDGNKPEQVRARAYIRALLGDDTSGGDDASTSDDRDIAARVQHRMATDDDPILSELGFMDADGLDGGSDSEVGGDEPLMLSEESELPHDEHTEEMVEIDSPISGEPLVLELGKMAQLGDLADLAGDDVLGDDDAAPMPSVEPEPPVGDVSTAIVADPSAPGNMLEVSLTPVGGGDGASMNADLPPVGVSDDAGTADSLPPLGGEEPEKAAAAAMHEKCAKCGNEEESCACKHAYSVFAYQDGQFGEEPIDQFRAAGLLHALKRVASHGVRGLVYTHEGRTDEAVIKLAGSEDCLLVRKGAAKSKSKAPAKGMPDPAISGQPKNVVSVDPAKVLKLTAGRVRQLCAARGITAQNVEQRLLTGETIVASTWAMRVTDAAQLEIARIGTNYKRTAALIDMDDAIAEYMAHIARATAVEEPYVIQPLFALRCAACDAVNEYVMPDAPESMRCASCEVVAEADVVAKTASREDAYTGYLLTALVPGEESERKVNAQRLLSAVKQVVADAQGDFAPATGKIAIELRTDEAALNRVCKVLAERYGVTTEPIAAPAATLAPQTHTAQLEPPPADAMPADMPADDLAPAAPAPDPAAPAAPMDAGDMPAMPAPLSGGGSTGFSAEEAEAIQAAFTHFRNMGLGAIGAFDQFSSKYRDLLDKFGDESSPSRHAAEAEVIRLAGDVYSKPAVLTMTAGKEAAAIKPSQGPSVNVPKPNSLLGKNSDEGHPVGLGGKVKVRTQVKPQESWTGPFSDMSLGKHSDAGHPAGLKGDKPKIDANVPKGALSDPKPEKQSDGTENKTTKSWDSVSKKAPSGIRSK